MRTFVLIGLALVITVSLGCDQLNVRPPQSSQPPTAPPVRKVCDNTQISIPQVRVVPLAHVRDHRRGQGTGDTEMAGHNPEITITADIKQEGPNLVLRGTVEMEEDRSDWTTFRAPYEHMLTSIGAECQYAGVDQPHGELIAHGGNDNHRWTKYQGSGLIKEADCLSDTLGNDDGKLGCTIVFQPVIARFANR